MLSGWTDPSTPAWGLEGDNSLGLPLHAGILGFRLPSCLGCRGNHLLGRWGRANLLGMPTPSRRESTSSLQNPSVERTVLAPCTDEETKSPRGKIISSGSHRTPTGDGV